MSNVTVSVYDGAILVAEKQRPVRRLPDGRFGVLFRGLVYPIGRAQQIQLRGGSHKKEECIVLDSVPEELQTSDANDPIIHLDASGKYKYLMVMGDEVALHFVLAVLRDSSAETLGYGKSARVADNGVMFDWYVRLDDAAAAKIGKLSELIGKPRSSLLRVGEQTLGDQPRPSGSAIPITRAQEERTSETDVLRARCVNLLTAIEKTERELAAARTSHKERVEDLEADQRRKMQMLHERETDVAAARAELARYRSAVEQLRASSDEETGKAARLADRCVQLETREDVFERKLVAAEAAREAAEMLGNTWADEAQQLKGRLEDEKEKAEDLDARVAELTTLVTKSASDTPRADMRIKGLIASAYVQIDFQRDSLEVIAVDLSNYRSVCALLTSICFRPQDVRAPKVESTQLWFERHFSTGSDDDGRAYFRRASDGRYQVLLSRKGNQAADVRWLRKAERIGDNH